MSKLALVLGLVVTVLVVESTSQLKFIHPTYRPPPQPRQPVIRTAREAGNDPQPLWLNRGDDVIRALSIGEHPVLPFIIDDVKLDPNTRHARSLTKDDVIDDIKLDPNTRHARSLTKDDVIDDIKLDPNTRRARSLTKDDVIDDIKLDPNTRHARSLSTPEHGRIGTNDRKSGSSRSRFDTRATHPGYNRHRRNTISLTIPEFFVTPRPFFNPKPWFSIPKPHSPNRFPVYV